MNRIILLAAMLASFTACQLDNVEKIQGNGQLESKAVEPGSFTEVKSSGEYQLTFLQDSLDEVSIEAESNLLPLIEVYVSGNTLYIENKDDYSFDLNHPINILIHHKGIEDLRFSGAGSIETNTLTGPDFFCGISGTAYFSGEITASNIDFNLSGSGTIEAVVECDELEASMSGEGDFSFSGTADKGVFNISGAGLIQARELQLKDCYNTISGVGTEYLSVSEFLKVVISGTGNIYYLGAPAIEKNISGLGVVEKLD